MSEIYTPKPEEQKPAPKQEDQDNFADIQAMQNTERYREEAAIRAQRIIEQPEAEQSEAAKKGWTKAAIAGTAAAAIAAGLGGGYVAVDHLAPSEIAATASATVGQGGDITSAIDKDLMFLEAQGFDPADATMRQDVISQAVKIHSDENNVVQPSENIGVIARKLPLSGTIVYEAAPKESENNQ